MANNQVNLVANHGSDKIKNQIIQIRHPRWHSAQKSVLTTINRIKGIHDSFDKWKGVEEEK
jgi:hypothetical protein